jgi:hypothetical protein
MDTRRSDPIVEVPGESGAEDSTVLTAALAAAEALFGWRP